MDYDDVREFIEEIKNIHSNNTDYLVEAHNKQIKTYAEMVTLLKEQVATLSNKLGEAEKANRTLSRAFTKTRAAYEVVDTLLRRYLDDMSNSDLAATVVEGIVGDRDAAYDGVKEADKLLQLEDTEDGDV